jgi:L-lactate permease
MEAITLIASVPAILALVNLAKKLGLDANLALVFSVVLGVAINVANYHFAANGTYQAAIQGLIIGLSAAGVYDASKTAGGTNIIVTAEQHEPKAATKTAKRPTTK